MATSEDNPYLALLELKWYFLCFHDLQQNLEGNNKIGIDNRSSLATLILWKSTRVDNAHLLDDRRLARFSSTWIDRLAVGRRLQ